MSKKVIIRDSIFEDGIYEIEKPRFKCRGRGCEYFNYDVCDGQFEENPVHNFCGLHGRATVELGMPVNLDRRGGCGYLPRKLQLNLF